MRILMFIMFLPEPFRLIVLKIIFNLRILVWNWQGKNNPPPKPIKILQILKIAKRYNQEKFIETGTYLGETIELVKNHFKKIYSVELSTDLYKSAKKVFSKDKNIKILHGDSSKVLPKILKSVNGKVLFWLDAHFSKGITVMAETETPIEKELTIIAKFPRILPVILIDDAREFKGKRGYPTISNLRKIIRKHFPTYQMEIKSDIIQICPK